jgi:hypothetical protein
MKQILRDAVADLKDDVEMKMSLPQRILVPKLSEASRCRRDVQFVAWAARHVAGGLAMAPKPKCARYSLGMAWKLGTAGAHWDLSAFLFNMRMSA